MAEKKETKKAAKPRKKAVKDIEETAVAAIPETNVVNETEVEAVNEPTNETISEPIFHDSGDVMFGNPDDYIETVDEKPESEPEEAEPEAKIDENIVLVYESARDFEKSKNEFEEKLVNADNEEEAKKLINDELKKIETLKNKVKKVAKKYSDGQISNSWNGMIQDW